MALHYLDKNGVERVYYGSTQKWSTRDLRIYNLYSYGYDPPAGSVKYLAYRENGVTYYASPKNWLKLNKDDDTGSCYYQPGDQDRRDDCLTLGVYITNWRQYSQSAAYQPTRYYTEATVRYLVFWNGKAYNSKSAYAVSFTSGRGTTITRAANTTQDTRYTIDGQNVNGWFTGTYTYQIASGTSSSTGYVSRSPSYFTPSGLKIDGKASDIYGLSVESTNLYLWQGEYIYDRQPRA